MNKSQRQKTALITGASSGIGYQLAYIFARNRYNLVLVDKKEEKLNEMADEFPQKFDIFVKIFAKDLSIPTSPEEIFRDLQKASIKVDVLVNNAGFGTYGVFAETDLTTELNMLQVNIVSLTHLTKLFLKDMVEQGYGKILNVASVAAFQPGPLMAVYFATKAYVLSFSEAIANELEGTGITVTALCPGPTATEFQQAAAMKDSKISSVSRMMDTETVAKIGYRSLMANKTVVVPGLRNKILAESVRFTPRSLVTKVVKSMHEIKKN
ncbi:SDR family oxidoreductase [Nostoc sp. 106C]|uniref:SDR family NAD(P)-dependent oxidoreductase n=1 Tax=Nostoc sp. 106C TaxID=1932667 RepID=UPI000A3855A8|nr:SDR family oxidoreductase [Nostoc sp. 106C]OUL18461.1 short-chain dehydrogenase [Nostoc sp. RF31YmG]OUL19187.1 short-chain dehydrogenase [Nostoc sp. 106C]